MTEDARFLSSDMLPTPKDSVEDLVDLIVSVKDASPYEVSGIALSLPGIIDVDRGYCLTGGALSFNYNQPLGRRLSDATGLPVLLENDAKCAALAELSGGALAGCHNGAVVVLGTGLGCGLVIDGKVVHGRHSFAGEMSFLSTNADRWADVSYKAGMRCSTRGLIGLVRELKHMSPDDPIDGRLVFSWVNAGDPAALDALHRYCRLLGTQLLNLSVLLDLEIIALGGGISDQDSLIAGVREGLDALFGELPPAVTNSPVKPPTVVRCHFGSRANQVGALYGFLRNQRRA